MDSLTLDMPPRPPPPPRATAATLVTWGLIMLAVLVPFGLILRPHLLSAMTGGLLAVLTSPLHVRLSRRLPPWASALVVTTGVLVGVLVPVTLLGVGAFRQGAVALEAISSESAPTLPEMIETVRAWLPPTDVLGTPEEIRAGLQSGLANASAVASRALLGLAQKLPALLLQMVIVVLSMYFLLLDGRRMFHWIAGKIPLSAPIRTMLVSSFIGATNAVVLASVAAASVQSLILLVAFLILGVPAALFAAGLAFVLAWIPPLGTVPVWASAALYLYVQGSHGKAAVMVGVGIVVGVTDNVVRPLVLRGREAMHPMVSLLAILGGLMVLGIPGVFIGPLLASLTIAVLDIWPAVATYCGVPVSDSGEAVPLVPMLESPSRLD